MKKSGLAAIAALLPLIFWTSPVAAQALNGEWEVVSGEFSGQKVPLTALQAMSLKVERQTFEAQSGTSASSGKYTESPRSNPPQLVFNIEQGADAGREIKAIYKVEPSGLTIVYSQGDDFPLEFNSTPENQNLLLTYKSKAAAPSTAARSRGGRKYGSVQLKATASGAGK